MELYDPLESSQQVQLVQTNCVKGEFATIKVNTPPCQRVSGSSYKSGSSFGVLLKVNENKCSSMYPISPCALIKPLSASRKMMWMVVIPIASFFVLALLTVGVCLLLKKLRLSGSVRSSPASVLKVSPLSVLGQLRRSG